MGHLYLSFWLNLGMADLYPWMFDDAHDASILISFSGNWCRDVFVGLFVLVWHVRAATVQIWPFCGLKSDPTASLIPRPLLARIQSTFPVFHQLVPIFQLNYPLLSNIPSASPIICMSLGYSRKCYSHPFSSCSIFQHLKSSRPAKKSPPFSPIFFLARGKRRVAASTVLPRPWRNGRRTTSWPKRCQATWQNPNGLMLCVYQCHTKHQHFGDGLYYTTHCNPFMVILGMLYFWVKKTLPHYASRWPCQ